MFHDFSDDFFNWSSSSKSFWLKDFSKFLKFSISFIWSHNFLPSIFIYIICDIIGIDKSSKIESELSSEFDKHSSYKF